MNRSRAPKTFSIIYRPLSRVEGGISIVGPAIANSVYNATGVRIVELPITMAKKLGYGELADLTPMGSRYWSNAFLTKRQFLVDNKARIEGCLHNLIEAIHFTKTHRAEALSILSRYTRTSDADSLSLIYAEYVQKVWPQIPNIQPEDLTLLSEQMAETDSEAREINRADLIYG